jgi:hypothetical protein
MRAGVSNSLTGSAAPRSSPPIGTAASSTGQSSDVHTSAKQQHESGETLIEHSPRLLVPLEVDGLALTSVDENTDCCGVHAVYVAKDAVKLHFGAEIWLSKDGELDPASKDLTATTVAGHPARMSDVAKLKSMDIDWSSGSWGGAVMIKYDSGSDRAAAHKVLLDIAQQAAGVLDQYLTGTPPTSTERDQHLAIVAQANANAAEASRRDAPQRLMTKIREFGIREDTVVRAELDPLGSGNDAIITVGPLWNRAVKEERLQAAQKIWQMWAAIMTPRDPDTSHVKLVDSTGNTVGRSGVMGSSIEVND